MWRTFSANLLPIVLTVLFAAAVRIQHITADAPFEVDPNDITFDLTPAGFIPAWVAAGPFEQPLVGFGQTVDYDVIGESTIQPIIGKVEETVLVEGGQTTWKPLHIDAKGFVDFNKVMGWVLPGDGPERVWKAKAGYAFVYIDSPEAQEAILKLGSNSSLKVLLNGQPVHMAQQDRNADPDTDTVAVALRAGRNSLLVKVGQTHRNEAPDFFTELRYEWGFYAKLLGSNSRPLQDISIAVPAEGPKAGVDLVSTFFFKEDSVGLRQQFDLVITSLSAVPLTAKLELMAQDLAYEATLDSIPFGESRHAILLSPVASDTPAKITLELADELFAKDVMLKPQPRYEIHLAMMSHTDIGYTNTQPIVKERHLRALDDVLKRLDEDSTFSWTIETVWQLEQYELGRPREKFDRLVAHIKAGRVAISPIYTNPYTGWVSAEELIHSFDKGRQYADQHDLRMEAAVYNDVPGLSWLMPQILEKAGVRFLATGINEVYNDYSLQRSLPKVFYWEGVGGGRVLTYRTEAYNEGQTLGLEKSVEAVPLRIWERLNRLRAQGYEYDVVLALHTFGDNGGIPMKAPSVAAAWNEAYAYPRISISNIDTFAEAFQARYRELPTLTGDWASTWEALYQGEPARMVQHRWAQHQIPVGEKMATLSWLLDSTQDPLSSIVNAAYNHLLHYSGHGSGLEYGYGSPRDNLTTMAFRELYVKDAIMATQELLERSAYRLAAREESFEGEGLYVFNALNWTRDATVIAEFPRENEFQYRAIDLTTQQVIPSYQSGHTLRFVARSVPPVGYKKIRLERITQAEAAQGGHLQTSDCAIENAFYLIEIDCSSGRLLHILDHKTGQDLIESHARSEFGQPLKADSLFSLEFLAMDVDRQDIYVRDERPARLTLVTKRDGHLFAQSEYTLWEDLDRVDIRHTVDLEKLSSPDQVEDYSIAFPFAIPDRHAAVEVLGGFLDAHNDRFSGVDHDAFSLRRSVALYNDTQSVSWATVGSRVVRLRENAAGTGPTIIANLVNNFPEAWNRWEENEGVLHFDFSFTSDSHTLRPSHTGRFGWEVNTPLAVRYTWLRSAPAMESFVSVDSEQAVLLTIKPTSDQSGVEFWLMNMDPRASAVANIASDLLDIQSGIRVSHSGATGPSLPVEGRHAVVTLPPGAIQPVRFNRAQ